MTQSTKTRLLLRDKCKVVHSDRLYRPTFCIHVVVYFSVLCVIAFMTVMTTCRTLVINNTLS